jgi:hypothetical protein
MSKLRISKTWVKKAARKNKGTGTYPAATIAFYGPNTDFASKVVVGIFLRDGTDADILERWFSEDLDVRANPAIGDQVLKLLRSNGVQSVVATDGIIGCPHEEGIDYPEGKSCPKCPFWSGRDRFTHHRIH